MMHKTFRFATVAATAAVLVGLVAGCNSMGMKPAMAAAPATSMNGMLAAPGGMTLYSFDKDTVNSGASTCNGPCAMSWPPFLATSTDMPSGDYTVITRADGAKQWAYKGWPLYTYSKDAKSGDMTGDNFKSVWHVVKG